MNHSFLISKGIFPKKFHLPSKCSLENNDIDEKELTLEETHPAYSKLVPLFSLHTFLKTLYPKLPQRKMLEKYLKDHIVFPESSASFASDQEESKVNRSCSEKRQANSRAARSNFDAKTYFKHEKPYFQEASEEYLLTFQQLYTLFFRILEREFTPSLQEMREYLMNRHYFEINIMQKQHAAIPMKRKILAIVTSKTYVDRISQYLLQEIQSYQLNKQHVNELNDFISKYEEIKVNDNTVEIYFQDSATEMDFKSFVNTFIASNTWRRTIQQILVLSHKGGNIFAFLNSIPEELSKVRVQAHPKWLQMDICRDIEILFSMEEKIEEQATRIGSISQNVNSSITLSPQDFQTVIEAYITHSGEIAVGLMSAEWWKFMVNTLDLGLAILPSHDENNIEICSKAYFKLHEIFEFDSRLSQFKETTNSIGVDIGASPGGWTQVLTKYCSRIYSVDPAQLDQELLNNYSEQIIHVQKKAELFLSDDLENGEHNTPFIDFLCCDMNADPKIVAKILKPFATFMKSGSFIVMTLKLIKHVNERIAQTKFAEAVKILEFEFFDFKCHWLFANTANERMLVAVRR